MIKLSIVIPTIARPGLEYAVESINLQMKPGDEVCFVCDGPTAYDRALWVPGGGEGYRLQCVETPEGWVKCGQWQRNWMLDNSGLLSGNYIVWGQDDDVFLPGAFDAIRRAAWEFPGRPLMFRMIPHWGGELPHLYNEKGMPHLGVGNVSEQMFVTPNDPSKLSRFTNSACGDWEFMRDTVALYGGEDALVWRPEVIVRCAPNGN